MGIGNTDPFRSSCSKLMPNPLCSPSAHDVYHASGVGSGNGAGAQTRRDGRNSHARHPRIRGSDLGLDQMLEPYSVTMFLSIQDNSFIG